MDFAFDRRRRGTVEGETGSSPHDTARYQVFHRSFDAEVSGIEKISGPGTDAGTWHSFSGGYVCIPQVALQGPGGDEDLMERGIS